LLKALNGNAGQAAKQSALSVKAPLLPIARSLWKGSIHETSSDRSPGVCWNSQGKEQGNVEIAQPFGRQFADIVGQSRLLKAHQPIALDRAFVLEALERAAPEQYQSELPLGARGPPLQPSLL
jgi:hypothetical protein